MLTKDVDVQLRLCTILASCPFDWIQDMEEGPVFGALLALYPVGGLSAFMAREDFNSGFAHQASKEGMRIDQRRQEKGWVAVGSGGFADRSSFSVPYLYSQARWKDCNSKRLTALEREHNEADNERAHVAIYGAQKDRKYEIESEYGDAFCRAEAQTS
jgi:hypothetical protein